MILSIRDEKLNSQAPERSKLSQIASKILPKFFVVLRMIIALKNFRILFKSCLEEWVTTVNRSSLGLESMLKMTGLEPGTSRLSMSMRVRLLSALHPRWPERAHALYIGAADIKRPLLTLPFQFNDNFLFYLIFRQIYRIRTLKVKQVDWDEYQILKICSKNKFIKLLWLCQWYCGTDSNFIKP